MSEGPTDPQLQSKVARGVAWSGASQAFIALADLVSHALVLAMWVPFRDYGIASMAVTLYAILDSAADLGVTSAIIQRDDHTPEKISTVFWFNVLISGGLFLALLIAGPLYGHFQGHPVVGWLLIVYGGKLLFQNVYAIPFAMLKKGLRFDEIAKARAVAHLGESIARVAFAAAGYTIWCFTLAALTRVFLFGVFMQLRHPFIPRLVFRPREVIDYLRFGVRSGASQILYQTYVNLDYVVVGHTFGAAPLGIYKLAYEIVLEPVRSITNVVADVAFPTFSRLRHERHLIVDQLIRFTRLNLVTVLPFLVIIALLVGDLLQVFAGTKTPAELEMVADCTRVLCFVGILRALGFLGPPLLDGLGRPELTLRYMVIAAVTLPLFFVLGAQLLGDRFGVASVAIAWAIGYPVAFSVLGYLVIRTTHMPLREYLRAGSGLVTCAAAGLAVGIGMHVVAASCSAPTRIALVGGSAIGVMIALFVFWQGITPKSIRTSMKPAVPASPP